MAAARAKRAKSLGVVVLVRHARAGQRERWQGDDRLRPLDGRGERQAQSLVGLLGPMALDRIVSSPFLRCVQTVEPLARALRVGIEHRPELGEDRQWSDGPRLVASLLAERAVVCCHGGLPEALVGEALKKGAAFVLEPAPAGVRIAERFAAP